MNFFLATKIAQTSLFPFLFHKKKSLSKLINFFSAAKRYVLIPEY